MVTRESSGSRGALGAHQQCIPGEPGCTGSGSLPPLRFIVHDFVVFENFEGAFLGSMEIEIRYANSNDEVIKVRKTGVEVREPVALDREIRDYYPIQSDFVMVETDLWPNPDDFIGQGILGTSSIVCDNGFDLSECEAVVSHVFP